MTYDPNRPRLVVVKNAMNTYNVVREQRGQSGKILASFPSKEQAEQFKRSYRP